MKVVELDESIYTVFGPCCFTTRIPVAPSVWDHGERRYIFTELPVHSGASVIACIPIWRKSTHQLPHFRLVKACESSETEGWILTFWFSQQEKLKIKENWEIVVTYMYL